MNGRIVHFGPRGHDAIQALLPWYASRSLDDDEMRAVRDHLVGCVQCRAEFELERGLREALSAEDRVDTVETGLARIHARIAAEAAAEAVARAGRRAAGAARVDRVRVPLWARWVAAAQFAVIVLLVGMLVAGPGTRPTMHALGTTGGAGAANAVVKFSPDATEEDIRGALLECDGRLVDGPSAGAMYLVHVPDGQVDEAVSRLRARPGVLLAESLGPGTRR